MLISLIFSLHLLENFDISEQNLFLTINFYVKMLINDL